jgi:hypothetical protein
MAVTTAGAGDAPVHNLTMFQDDSRRLGGAARARRLTYVID